MTAEGFLDLLQMCFSPRELGWAVLELDTEIKRQHQDELYLFTVGFAPALLLYMFCFLPSSKSPGCQGVPLRHASTCVLAEWAKLLHFTAAVERARTEG